MVSPHPISAQSIEILHEHKDWWLCYKPEGMNIHQEDDQLGFCQQLSEQLQQPVWPVHRLDKSTSGLILVARSSESANTFEKLFSERNIEKYYLAISDQKPKKKQGWIKGDMAKGRNGSWLLQRTMNNPAITQFISQAIEGLTGHRAFLVKLHSGKTHQIRVALKSLGSPILGDTRYKGSKAERCYLHAYALRFEWLGETFSFVRTPMSSQGTNTRENINKAHWKDYEASIATWSSPWDYFT